MNKIHGSVDKKMSQLPSWLWTTSNLLPPLYRHIWEGVKEHKSVNHGVSGSGHELLVDTNKVFPLLLTSQLPTEVLGYIWSLANQKFAGQLTEQELYVVLALVAIAQASYTFSSLDVLHLIPAPPIPNLNLSLLDGKSAAPARAEPKPHHVASSFDNNDDFSDFQSAPTTSISSIPSIPILDSKQGSAIGSRLANHNLGVKKLNEKPKKTNAGKHISASHMRHFNGKDQGAGEQLTDMFPKCSLKTQSKVVILRDTAIRGDISRGEDSGPKEVVNIAEKTPPVNNNAPSIQTSWAKVTPPKIEAEANRLDLMGIQPVEDKYSALRILVEEPQLPNSQSNLGIESVSMDDFGDFVSAEQPKTTFNSAPDNESVDFFSGFDFKESNITCGIDSALIQGISNSFCNLSVGTASDPVASSEKFDISSDSDKVTQKEDNISVNSIELGNGPLGLPRSGSVPSLDLKCFLTNSQDDEHQVENMYQLIYWEWKQYMESCVLLLQVAANIFTTITSEDVLHEVLASAQGYNFLCNLAEVAAVCRRVHCAQKELDINIMGFDELLTDIDRTWAEMEPFYWNIPIVTELPVWPLHQSENITCSLCLTVVTSGRIVHNENNYHVTCANLWLNCVNSNLPVLSYNLPSLTTTALSNSHV